MESKIQFLHPLDDQKMQFSKPGKDSIITKSTTFAPFCYPYVNLLNFVSFHHKSQQLFFIRKTKILLKIENARCVLTVNKYLHQLPWADCAVVELSQKKKEFQYQMYFMLSFIALSSLIWTHQHVYVIKSYLKCTA